MEIFIPINNFEIELCRAKNNETSIDEFIRVLINSDLALPSAGEVLADGQGFTPITYDKNGIKMLAAFTDKLRIGA